MGRRQDSPKLASPLVIAGSLHDVARASGGSRNEQAIALSALGTSFLMFGSGETLLRATIDHFSSTSDRLSDEAYVNHLRQLWGSFEKAAPFLTGHLWPLTAWMDTDDLDRLHCDLAISRRCFGVLASIDLVSSAEAIDGELLGPVYTFLRSKVDKQASGAFYTPMSVSRMIAAMQLGDLRQLPAGASILEPACGAGSMVIALAKEMRAIGIDPATYSWTLNDLDPMAVALAGVNSVVFGLGLGVRLCCGDGLLLGSGGDGDPLGG